MIRFLSKAAASFVMTDPVAEQVFKALHLELQVPGVWTVDRLEEIAARLEEALQSAKEQDRTAELSLQRAREAALARGEMDDLIPRDLPIGLSRRLVPVLQMVRRAQTEGQPVVWEQA
jgi:hypothetical protein